MKISKVKQYDPRIGWSIFVIEFSKENFKQLTKLLYNMGMKESKYYKSMEVHLLKKSRDISLRKKYSSKHKSGLVKFKENLKQQIWKIKGPRAIQKTFTDQNNFFDYTYLPSKKYFSTIWRSKKIDGQEFASLLLSNIN